MNRWVKLLCHHGLRGQSAPTTTGWHKQHYHCVRTIASALMTNEPPPAVPPSTQKETLTGRAHFSWMPRCCSASGGVRRRVHDSGLSATSLSAAIRAAATGPRTPSEDEIRLAADPLFTEARQLLATPLHQLATTQSAAAPTEWTLTERPLSDAHGWTSATPLRDVVSPAELKQVTNRAILDVNLATWANEKNTLKTKYGADFLLLASSANRADVEVNLAAACALEQEKRAAARALEQENLAAARAEVQKKLADELKRLPSGVSTVGHFVTHQMNKSALDFPQLRQLVGARCRALAVKFLDLAATLPVGDKPFQLTSTDAPFCGDDRNAIIDKLIKATKNDKGGWKESEPIHCIVSSPRLGKSRVLEEYARRVRAELPAVRAISITFNSQTPIDDAEVLRTKDEVHWHVLARVFLTLTLDHLPLPELRGVWMIGGALLWDDVKWFVKKANNGRYTKVVLVADALPKLVYKLPRPVPERRSILMSAVTVPLYSGGWLLFASGFLKEDCHLLVTMDNTPVVRHYLGPVQASTSDSYDELRQLAKEVCTAGLYNQIRFVPGLMGLALENAKKNKGTIQSALYPPLLGDLSAMHPDQKQKTQLQVLAEMYLTYVATKKYPTTVLELSPEVDMALDRGGVLMRYINQRKDAGTFVPYYLLHDVGGQHLLSPFKLLLDSDLTCRTARGKYFEALLLVALRLRAKYSLPESMSVGDLVRLLGGKSLLSVGNGAVDAELVTLGNENLDAGGDAITSFPPFVSFPCHTETTDQQQPRWTNAIEMNQSNTEAALHDFHRFVAQPTAKFNKGCDVVQVATLSSGEKMVREKMVLLFETRFWQSNSFERDPSQIIGEKALFCLIGLLANYRGMFRRAAFVYFTTAFPSFRATDLLKAQCEHGAVEAEVKAIRATKGVTLSYSPTLEELVDVANKVDPNLNFTVHVVACPGGTKDASPELLSCMMGSLAYVCPDFELTAQNPVSRTNMPASVNQLR